MEQLKENVINALKKVDADKLEVVLDKNGEILKKILKVEQLENPQDLIDA